MRRLLQHWTESSILPALRERSVWRNKKPKKLDRFLRGRQIAYLIYEYFRVTGANDSVDELCRPIYNCSFEMMICRNSIRNGTEFYCRWHKSHLIDILESLYNIKNTRVWETQDRIGPIVQCGDSSEESWTWLSQIEDNGKKKYRAELCEWRVLTPKWKLREERRSQESKGKKTAWTKNSWIIVGNGSPTGSVWKETIAVSATIWISVEKLHHQIRLRVLLRDRMREMHREPEVPEADSPSGRMSRLPCKDYIKGTCTNSFC